MTDDKHTTQERLLDAAEQLFAAKGFQEVSIRELAAAADVNVAAVNYHFQGKENLYREVILRRFVTQRDRTLAALNKLLGETGGSPALDQVVGALVGQYLAGALSAPGQPSFLKLMGRELQNDQPHANAHFFKQLVAPVFEAYSQALLTACPDLDREQMNWIMASIVGQVHHFIIRRLKIEGMPKDAEARPVMLRAFPALELPTDRYIDEVTRHITRFSTAAIEGLRKEAAS